MGQFIFKFSVDRKSRREKLHVLFQKGVSNGHLLSSSIGKHSMGAWPGGYWPSILAGRG